MSSYLDMDLETTVAARYEGEARLQRLLWISMHAASGTNSGIVDNNGSPSLVDTALQLALDYAMQDGNVRRYKETIHLLQQQRQNQKQPAAHADGSAIHNNNSNHHYKLDTQWITEQTNQNLHAREVLLSRLASAQAHLNKEAIRVAYLALAQHDQLRGDVTEAFHSVLRAKDYCTSRPQTATVSLQILQLAIHLQNYKTVQEYAAKLSHVLPSSSAGIRYKVLVAAGLERLAARDYAVAAQKMMGALSCLGSDSSTSQAAGAADASNNNNNNPDDSIGWNTVLAPDDVALYAAFLALATVDSSDKLVALTEHPEAFELAPQAFEAVLLFGQQASYRQAWTLLEESLFPALQLDLYMALHFDALRQKIREKSLLSHWRAYQRIELSVLCTQMGPGILPPDRAEEILTDLIQRGSFPADTRLDLQEQALVRLEGASADQERLQKTKAKLAAVSAKVMDDAYSMVVRLACLEHDLSVADPNARRRGRGQNRGGGVFAGYDAGGFAGRGFVLNDSDGEDDVEPDDADMADVGIAETDEMNPEDLY